VGVLEEVPGLLYQFDPFAFAGDERIISEMSPNPQSGQMRSIPRYRSNPGSWIEPGDSGAPGGAVFYMGRRSISF
jgi:hypothetical protein